MKLRKAHHEVDREASNPPGPSRIDGQSLGRGHRVRLAAKILSGRKDLPGCDTRWAHAAAPLPGVVRAKLWRVRQHENWPNSGEFGYGTWFGCERATGHRLRPGPARRQKSAGQDCDERPWRSRHWGDSRFRATVRPLGPSGQRSRCGLSFP